jgi:hypothetical protein
MGIVEIPQPAIGCQNPYPDKLELNLPSGAQVRGPVSTLFNHHHASDNPYICTNSLLAIPLLVYLSTCLCL